MKVLGIESSCDETGVAIYDSHAGLVAHQLHSQIALHQQYGGVVPELASRDHVKYLVPLVSAALEEAKMSKSDLDAVAYTAGPGLMGALLTGACFAKSFAFSLAIPALAINHLEAHLLAAQLDDNALEPPYLALLVSGGHTQLIAVHQAGSYELLGDTLDDAVGEAFDKTAKLMGIDYPGGPMLAKLADECPIALQTLPAFPRPMTDRPGLDFSFSGLKTHALNAWNHSSQDNAAKQQIAYAFQQAVVETLVIKCHRAIKQTNMHQLIVAGGVGANRYLRQQLAVLTDKHDIKLSYPSMQFCTDNGAMVAYAGWKRLIQGETDEDLSVVVKARWPLSE
ncbi:tRNA (adenosine(37)-N6)-threonylcarbamoyltransferase complex transferase subunit TsaD [Legionella sp. W05-934-2]|jgi:N6-L-threonylcarbamoyladenine synthase|uniref:tRNA (adenosine(37)-N6)-threonylcarbamoyltransferase complex transferase subunit TsaD n=1 Tax=Legionella sp. W05-934-2 TaxID=1198649 RepID=UPI0034629083